MSATGFTKGDPQKVARAGDTMTGELILPDSSPDTSLAAASRGYVDNTAASVTAASEIRYVNVTGDTMTGPLTLSAGGIDVDVQEAFSTNVSTGWIHGGVFEISATPNAMDLGAGAGYIVDVVTNPTAPVVTRISVSAQTILLDSNALLRQVTWWLIDSSGNIIQQADKPTNSQRRTHLVIGATLYAFGIIMLRHSQQQVLPQVHNQMLDLMDALGTFIIDGAMASANGANLMINQSAGNMFIRSIRHFVSGVTTDDPHVTPILAQASGATLSHTTQVINSFGALTTTLDVAHYDVGGVVTLIPGGANTSTVFRVWNYPSADPTRQITIQYGQTAYTSLDAAVTAIQSSQHVVNPQNQQNAGFAGWIAAIKSATNLSDPTQARFIKAGRFSTP